MFNIQDIYAYEILDSRGNPTVCCVMQSTGGDVVQSKVPSGASTGKFEAYELRDLDSKRFKGKGVLKAIENINHIIKPAVVGRQFESQNDFDEVLIKMDGTINKSKLGANAILAVSMAFSRLFALSNDQHLYESFHPTNLIFPTPMFNLINGGKHADSGLEIQEFMIFPIGINDFKEKVRAGAEIFHTLKSILAEKGHKTSVGDEGGFAPNLSSSFEALDLLSEAVKKAGYKLGEEIFFCIDAAANEFYVDGKYKFTLSGEKHELTSDQLLEVYGEMIEKYPFYSIEDPFQEEDIQAWQKFTKKFGDKIQIVGDDLLVTNTTKLSQAIEGAWCNAILIKPNQIGTVTETLKAISMAQNEAFNVVISHRSGETDDTFISDLALGVSNGQIKTGAPSRGERVAKYNRLLEIYYSVNINL
ncbi:phosphopyruvate hydratase [bacterium]|jgi:enolase|nr:phosphopyruvate hydratase [bacterium]MBT6293952.1 phosphopyruvate hydratase [bacterium]